MPFQTEIVGPVGLFSMNLIMVFETQFITIWSSNWWGWIKSIRSLKTYTETGPHGAPTWSSLWKKKNLWRCFRGWSFLVNVPFLAVKLVEVQAFLFSYTKPYPILKEIIAFKLYIVTLTVLTEIIICKTSVFMQPIYLTVTSTKPIYLTVYLYRQNIWLTRIYHPSWKPYYWYVMRQQYVTHHFITTCGWAVHRVDWCVVSQFMKKSLLFFRWSLHSYIAN